ncbi:hypothetical protein [Flavobacterium sp.]|uniref:hypothetical protein n=1 Tax=Flavobacterium sp. TaxID=239 RepID=UPI00122976FE|nr:hypothetical protein [Flavobacterium sp.]RZJ72897.1 MAG: hypothetical protein EOO49_04490 [Flavobacterium sp.]
MKIISLLELEKHKNPDDYKFAEDWIYEDLHDEMDGSRHRIGLVLELEEGEDSQYPLEDLLDAYFLHVADFLDTDMEAYFSVGSVMNLELGGDLEDIRKIKEIVGKRAFTEEFDEDGSTYLRLKIE